VPGLNMGHNKESPLRIRKRFQICSHEANMNGHIIAFWEILVPRTFSLTTHKTFVKSKLRGITEKSYCKGNDYGLNP
jgi:hypothetical protein